MGESITSRHIGSYMDGLIDKTSKIRNILENFKNKITEVTKNTLESIPSGIKKIESYENMANDIQSFKKEINGRISDCKIVGNSGEYVLGSNNSKETIAIAKLREEYKISEDYATNEQTLEKINKKITEVDNERQEKQLYYNKWFGGTQIAEKTSLVTLIGKYDFSKNDGELKLANVLKKQGITKTINSDEQKDSDYLVFKKVFKEEETPENQKNPEKIKLEEADVKIEFEGNLSFLIDDKLVGINRCFDKLKKYMNYCDDVVAYLVDDLCGDDRNSDVGFGAKLKEFFWGNGDKGHPKNKVNLNTKNDELERTSKDTGELLVKERLEDYYYIEDSNSRKYFQTIKERANDYDKIRNERRDFIKTFCDEFESQSSYDIFKGDKNNTSVYDEIGKFREQQRNINNEEITKQVNSGDKVKFEMEEDLKITSVKISLSSIFPDQVKGPWSEEWETKKVEVLDIGGGAKIAYPLMFNKFDSEQDELKKCADFLTETLQQDINTLEGNIETFKVRRDEIKTEVDKQKAEIEEQRKAEEEARRQAEEEARRQAEEEARRQAEEEARRQAEEEARRQAEEEARRQAEEEARREAIREAMGGGED